VVWRLAGFDPARRRGSQYYLDAAREGGDATSRFVCSSDVT
jgi:hypothetical protein